MEWIIIGAAVTSIISTWVSIFIKDGLHLDEGSWVEFLAVWDMKKLRHLAILYVILNKTGFISAVTVLGLLILWAGSWIMMSLGWL